MLPFSSYEFFIIMGIWIAVLAVCKKIVADKNYNHVLTCLNALFLIIIYPKPLHFLLLIIYAYSLTFLLTEVIVIRKKILGILLLLLPMLIVKLDIRFDFYPFELNRWMSFAGLSYASFRIIGYYMDKAPGQKMTDVFSYFNFLAFTPTLLIGPIDKFSRFKASLDRGFSNINVGQFITGWNALVKGIAFKYVLAELVDRCWLNVYDPHNEELTAMINTMYSYYFYLFFDFAGYSFMALGIGKMMGVHVPVNFTNPFVAVNPQDFWRRFHISLGDWLKEYFFSPLYLYFSRKKSLKSYPLTRQNIALVLTFLLMGCWNGFKFHYLLSGLLFGIYAAVHNTYVMQCRKKEKDVIFGNLNPVAVKWISIFLTFHFVAVALYIFSGRCPLL